LALVAAAAPGAARAQLDDLMLDAAALPEAAEALEGETEGGLAVVVAPVPILDPTLGVGVAPVGLLTFPISDAPGARRSTLGLVAAYTDRGSWMLGAGMQLHLAEDRWRVGLTGAYGALELDFYGIGGESRFLRDPVAFSLSGLVGSATVQRRVADGLYVGPALRAATAEIGLALPIPVLPRLSASFDVGGLGLLATYDTRDEPWAPREGDVATLFVMRYENTLGFGRTFWALDADAARYRSLGPDLVLAGQARVAAAGDSAPFYMLPFLNFRGFPAGRFLDSAVVQAQAELRWRVAGRLGAVAFGGVGVVADGFEALGEGATGHAGGVGLRWRVSSKDRMNLGFDLAYGSTGETTAYFRVGEAF
jgi:hypothetical protein